MKKAVFGLVNNTEQANRIVDRLLSSDIANEDISILFPERNKATGTTAQGNAGYNNPSAATGKRGGVAIERGSKASEGGVVGAATGGVLGGSLGLLAGIGTLAIPGLGPFIAAGPLLAALSGSAVGGSVGLLVGAIIGFGIPEYEAKKYESALKAGNILISVHTETDEEVKTVTEVMKREGAKDISTTSEKARTTNY